MEADLDYYRRRAEQERAAAAVALDVNAREAHLRLAAEYDQRSRRLETERGDQQAHVASAA
ncbi:MAG: hypothetical protein ACTHJK_00320 [Sphingomicrobium sp.]